MDLLHALEKAMLERQAFERRLELGGGAGAVQPQFRIGMDGAAERDLFRASFRAAAAFPTGHSLFIRA